MRTWEEGEAIRRLYDGQTSLTGGSYRIVSPPWGMHRSSFRRSIRQRLLATSDFWQKLDLVVFDPQADLPRIELAVKAWGFPSTSIPQVKGPLSVVAASNEMVVTDQSLEPGFSGGPLIASEGDRWERPAGGHGAAGHRSAGPSPAQQQDRTALPGLRPESVALYRSDASGTVAGTARSAGLTRLDSTTVSCQGLSAPSHGGRLAVWPSPTAWWSSRRKSPASSLGDGPRRQRFLVEIETVQHTVGLAIALGEGM